MNPFDAVFELNALEKMALLAEDMDLVEEYLPKREQAIEKALQSRNTFSDAEFKQMLLRLHAEQNELAHMAATIQAEVQAHIGNTRKQNRYLNGNAYTTKQMGKSFYCDKQS